MPKEFFATCNLVNVYHNVKLYSLSYDFMDLEHFDITKHIYLILSFIDFYVVRKMNHKECSASEAVF